MRSRVEKKPAEHEQTNIHENGQVDLTDAKEVLEEKSDGTIKKLPYEHYVQLALHARENKDNAQWVLGDIANHVKVFYGEDSIGKLAFDIGLKKSTLMTYRLVARIFGPGRRLPAISFTHHQTCVPTKDPVGWLHKAADNMWSCEKLAVEIKNAERPGEQTEKAVSAACTYLIQVIKECVDRGSAPTQEEASRIVTDIVRLYKKGE